jgi:hypothetical protein
VAGTDKELDSELADFATRIEKLRIRYQGFFLGLEKLPPLFERDQMEKYIRQTSLNDAHRAVHKFRFMALLQRFRTLAVQWDRVLRDLEEGRTTRESMRREAGYAAATTVDRPGASKLPMAAAARGPGRRAAKKAAAAAAAAAAEAEDGATAGEEASAPAPLPVQVDSLQRLYADYITARSSLGLPNEGITEPAFRASLEKQRQAQAEKLGVPSVSFSVVVKEGRVILLARPLKEAPGA